MLTKMILCVSKIGQKITERPNNLVTSSAAKKAFAIFPNESDRFNILESIKEEEEEQEAAAIEKAHGDRQQKTSFAAFLTGKKKH